MGKFFESLPPRLQWALAAAVCAVVPLLPGLLDTTPELTPKELARIALSAACGAFMLGRAKPGSGAPAPKP